MSPYTKICASDVKLTPQEKSLVLYIQREYPDCLLNSATSIAKRLGMSASTVVRFFAKLSYSSFQEMQREVRSEIMAKLPTPVMRASVAPSQVHQGLSASLSIDKQNMDAMQTELDEAAFERLIDRIVHPGRGMLYIAAAKNSRSIALHLATHLNMCVPNVKLLSADGAAMADSLLWAESKDTLLAFSIRRYSNTTYQAARHFKGLGAEIITFTDSPKSPIAKIASQNFRLFTHSDSPFDSCTAAFGLCTAIINATAARNWKKVQSTLRRGEQLWNDMGVFTAPAGSSDPTIP